jgi:hypothetical protein
VIERQPWFTVACCPPNVMRLLASLGEYVMTYSERAIQVQQYVSGTFRAPDAELRLETDYPWRGEIAIHVVNTNHYPWTLQLRIPEWATGFAVHLNGNTVDVSRSGGYVGLQREWHVGDRLGLSLELTPRLTEPHPRVESANGCLAIERGPLVYCVEQADHPSTNVLDLRLNPDAALAETWRSDLLDQVITVQAVGAAADPVEWGPTTFRAHRGGAAVPGHQVSLTAIPYYTWANRGPGAMRVWIPTTN